MLIESRLYSLASQENCDGEPYDTMQEAADEIRVLRSRIAELEEVLDRMRRDGCGLASPIHSGSSEFGNCREKFPGEPDEWCWSCQAHEALNS